MEYWEPTLKRSQTTFAVWNQHIPGFKVGTKSTIDLKALTQAFESLAQGRITAEFEYDEAYRAVQRALDTMKVLVTGLIFSSHRES